MGLFGKRGDEGEPRPRDQKKFGFDRYLYANRFREVTMQRCIKTRKVKLCPREQKKIGFDRHYHARDAFRMQPVPGLDSLYAVL